MLEKKLRDGTVGGARRRFAALEQKATPFIVNANKSGDSFSGPHKFPISPITPQSSPSAAPSSSSEYPGTTSTSYKPFIDSEDTGLAKHHHISAQNAYKPFCLEELCFADIQPKEKEIITISDDESETRVDLKSEVKTEGTWRWREYVDPNTSTAAAASSKREDHATSKDSHKPSNGVLEAPWTPPPSTQKPPRSPNPATTPTRIRVTNKMGTEKEEGPTAEEPRELGRAYRMRPS